MQSRLALLMLLLVMSCQPSGKPAPDLYTSALFKDVQQQAIFPDSKTFADCTPRFPLEEIFQRYEVEKEKQGFQLRAFVEENFHLPLRPQAAFKTDSLASMEEHLRSLWPTLTRNPDDAEERSSLLPLPHPYVVPGGRFSEIYYWDSYFTMLGLKESGRWDLIQNMIDNFAFLIDSVGFIPNGNRSYYLTRSQPPFFSLMIKLLEENDSTANVKYLTQLQKEYDFWMRGLDNLKKPGDVSEHVVMMPDGSILNRYFDKGMQPRPEAFKEDVHVAKLAAERPENAKDDELIFNNLRSAAESGWDFSSRWLQDSQTLQTIQTGNIIPVDLNCLLYHLERMLASGYEKAGDQAKDKFYRKKASERRRAILTFFWSSELEYFFDYNFRTNKQSPVKSLAEYILYISNLHRQTLRRR